MSRTKTNRRTDREQYTRSNAATARLLTTVKPAETLAGGWPNTNERREMATSTITSLNTIYRQKPKPTHFDRLLYGIWRYERNYFTTYLTKDETYYLIKNVFYQRLPLTVTPTPTLRPTLTLALLRQRLFLTSEPPLKLRNGLALFFMYYVLYSQPLPAPYKRLINGLKQKWKRQNNWTTDNLTINKRLLNCNKRRIETHQWQWTVNRYRSVVDYSILRQ